MDQWQLKVSEEWREPRNVTKMKIWIQQTWGGPEVLHSKKCVYLLLCAYAWHMWVSISEWVY